MADTTALKNRVRAAIKANDNQEITGPVLQQALLDIVDELNEATETEANARQNGDVTLQQDITQLGELITGIKNNINNGYVYAGIAIPSTAPVSGKVFYIALQAGTYANFGNTVVTQGINILKYSGSVWSKDVVIGMDDKPTIGSNNFVKSSGIASNLPFIPAQYVDANGNVVNNAPYWYSSPYLAISNLNIDSINLRTNGSQSLIHYIAFFDNKFKFISGVNGSGGDENNRITQIPDIPSNARYIKFSAYHNAPLVIGKYADYEGLGYCIGNDDNNLKIQQITTDSNTKKLILNEYIDANGNFISTPNAFIRTGFIKTANLTISNIKIHIRTDVPYIGYISFYDKNFNFISKVDGSNVDANKDITAIPTIPSSASYMAMCAWENPIVFVANYFSGKADAKFVEYSKEFDKPKQILNQYIDANGNFISTPNAFIRTGFIKTANLTISNIKIHIKTDVPYIGYISFYDKNFNFISKFDGSNVDANNDIVNIPYIPQNAAYMALCAWENPIVFVANYYSGKFDVNDVPYSKEFDKPKQILNQYLDANGSVVSTPNAFIRTGFIKTANLTISNIKIHIRTDVPYIGYISFYDKNFNFISKVDGSNVDANKDITAIPTIPSSASYMAMCAWENPIVFVANYYNGKFDVNDVPYAITNFDKPYQKVADKAVFFDKPYQKVADKAVFLGDSISSVLGRSYGAPVGQLLQEWGVIGNVEIKAHAGDVILNGLTQLENATTVNPDIVFVAFGVNDWGLTQLDGIGEWFTESTTEGITKRNYDITSNTIKSRFNQLYAAIRNKYPLTRVIMQTVIKKGDNSRTEGGVYVYSPDYLTKNNNMYLDEIRGAILDMPRVCNIEAVDMWQVCGLDPTIASNKTAYFVDFTHPNADGHKLMAEAMYKYLISH